MSKINAEPFVDRVEDIKEVVRFVSIFFEQTKQILNNGLVPQDNFNARILTVSFPAATTNQPLAHGLGRVPLGYIVLRRSSNIQIYDGTSPSNTSTLFLASSGAGSATVWVL